MITKDILETDGKNVARVTFTVPGNIWADSIYLVADFNGWDRLSHPFHRDRGGDWTISVELEIGRSYQFYYLSDGTDRMYEAQAGLLAPLQAYAG